MTAAGTLQRGQRVFCSNRGKRAGCGKSYSLMFCDVLPRHTMNAKVLWAWILGLLSGKSVQEAAMGLPFAMETFRTLKTKITRILDRVRTRLMDLGPPPESKLSAPLLHTFEHLRMLFAASSCPVADFQLHFQTPFLG